MGLLSTICGKRCEHEYKVTDTIKDKYYTCKDGTFAYETDIMTCSKCGNYYFLHKGPKKQDKGFVIHGGVCLNET